MKIKTVTYKRVKNLGNYQSEILEMFAEVDEGEDPEQVTRDLMIRVKRALFPESTDSDSDAFPF